MVISRAFGIWVVNARRAAMAEQRHIKQNKKIGMINHNFGVKHFNADTQTKHQNTSHGMHRDEGCESQRQTTHQQRNFLLLDTDDINQSYCKHGFPSKDIGVERNEVLRDIEPPVNKNFPLQCTRKIYVLNTTNRTDHHQEGLRSPESFAQTACESARRLWEMLTRAASVSNTHTTGRIPV